MAMDKVCGKCGGPVVERMPITKRNSNSVYSKKCNLCNNWFPLHHQCLRTIIEEDCIVHPNKDEYITPAEWAKSKDQKFRCKKCQTPCFVCFKIHKYSRERFLIECKECTK